MSAWHVRLFTQDVGRKLLALFFALILFDLLDKKIQADDRLTVKVVYWDEADLDRVPEEADQLNRLIVAERGPGPKPLVVASDPRPDLVTFLLHATKDSIERAKSHRHTFVLRLAKEGPVQPSLANVEGLQPLLDVLGTGARVEIEPLVLLVEPEESRSIELVESDLVLRGTPPPGFDRKLYSAVFRPTEVRLVGPRSSVEKAMNSRQLLFESLQLDSVRSEVTQDVALYPDWRRTLRLQKQNGEPLRAVSVTVRFERRMAPVPAPDGLFDVPVQAICNDDLLRSRDPQKRWSDGWRLEFPKARDGELKLTLKILAPETFTSAPQLDRAKLKLAKENVELIVRAHDATGLTLPVSIQKFPDFPPDLDVVFADGTRRAEVEVRWAAPPASRGDSKEKSSGDGGADDGN